MLPRSIHPVRRIAGILMLVAANRRCVAERSWMPAHWKALKNARYLDEARRLRVHPDWVDVFGTPQVQSG